MRSRTVNEPEHEEVPARIQRKPPKRVSRGKRLKTLDLGALISFNYVKEWVRVNEPEDFDAFKPKSKAIKKIKRKNK